MGNQGRQQDLNRQWTLAGMAVFFCCVWIPLLVICCYAFPSCDDFSYTGALYQAIRGNLGIKEILKAAWDEAMMFYHYWQGRYVDDIISAFGFGVAIPRYFAISVALVQGVLLSGVIGLGKELLQKRLGWGRAVSWCVILIALSWILLYLPHPAEGLYWYVGATGYTATFGWMLWMITGILAFYRATEKRKKIAVAIGTMIATILVAGSNYATGLLALEVLVLMEGVLLVIKKGRGCKFLTLVLIEYLCGFAANALSEGNTARQNNVAGLSPINSILASLERGFAFLIEWFHIPVAIFLIVMILLSARSLAAMSYRFRMPGLIAVISFGLMSSVMTPAYFASATWGPGRLINIVYLSYVLLLTGTVLYVEGWILHRSKRLSEAVMNCNPDGRYGVLIVAVMIVLLLGCMKYYGLQSTNSTSAALSILKGEAQTYRTENAKRWMTYEARTGMDVVIDDFSVKPYVLYHDDITSDATDWRNGAVADFFGLNSVRIEAE